MTGIELRRSARPVRAGRIRAIAGRRRSRASGIEPCRLPVPVTAPEHRDPSPTPGGFEPPRDLFVALASRSR